MYTFFLIIYEENFVDFVFHRKLPTPQKKMQLLLGQSFGIPRRIKQSLSMNC